MAKNSFSDQEILVLDQFLKTMILEDTDRVQRGEVYTHLKDKIGVELQESHWLIALSDTIKSGKISGYKIIRGAYGGISKDNPQVADNKKSLDTSSSASQTRSVKGGLPSNKVSPPAPPAPPLPTKVEERAAPAHHGYTRRHLWINRKLFLVPMLMSDIRKLLSDVLDCSEDENGEITFDGVKWKCKDIALLERFLLNYFHALNVGESDPILNDESGVPIELML